MDLSETNVKELQPKILVEWIENNNNNFIVVDVRNSDYGPFKIINSIHRSANDLTNDYNLYKEMKQLINELKIYENVVFHCAYSMVRGPKCAALYSKIRQDIIQQKDNDNFNVQNVYVLEGGIVDWLRYYRDQEHLIEKVDTHYDKIRNKNTVFCPNGE